MKIVARDIMDTGFHSISPEIPISEAVRIFKQASHEEGRRIFGMMVLDQNSELVGMLSMFDILLLMRPKHVHIWGKMEDIDLAGIIDHSYEKAQSIRVGDIMTREIVTTGPDTHKFMILDIMIKQHIRRLPVVEDGKILGIVYISDLFYDILDRVADESSRA
jgi:CBS domain-containing protein